MDKTVDVIVLDGYKAACKVLMDIFGVTNPGDLDGYQAVISVMRHQHDRILEEVSKPIIVGMFAAMGYSPTTPHGRKSMQPFVKNIADAVDDAYVAILQKMEQSQGNAALLKNGRPDLIR